MHFQSVKSEILHEVDPRTNQPRLVQSTHQTRIQQIVCRSFFQSCVPCQDSEHNIQQIIRHSNSNQDHCHISMNNECILSIFLCFQAAVTRCSQPLAGFSARCVEDEQMLQAVLKANPKSNFMYVVDTRPKVRGQPQKYTLLGMSKSLKEWFMELTTD